MISTILKWKVIHYSITQLCIFIVDNLPFMTLAFYIFKAQQKSTFHTRTQFYYETYEIYGINAETNFPERPSEERITTSLMRVQDLGIKNGLE
jgi:hypothetical protein